MAASQPTDGEWVLALPAVDGDARAIVKAWREEYDPEQLVADDDIRIDYLCGRGLGDGVRIWVRSTAS
jgi:hypothetical protein